MLDNIEKALEEVWQPVLGYEGIYKVSDLGNICNVGTGRILKPNRNKHYDQVCLYRNGSRTKPTIHRVVMEAFIGKSNLIIDHINEVKRDNRLCNLEYVTIRENARRYRVNRRTLPIGVYERRRVGLYQASIGLQGRSEYLGAYKTPEEAEIVFLRALELSVAGLKIKEIIPIMEKENLVNKAIIKHGESNE